MMNPHTAPNDKAKTETNNRSSFAAPTFESDHHQEELRTFNKSLPFVPLLPDDIQAPPLPQRSPPLAPRKRKPQEKKQVFTDVNHSSLLSSSFSSGPMKDLSLLGMVSLEMAHQHCKSDNATSLRFPALDGPPGANNNNSNNKIVLPKTSLWTQTTGMSDIEDSTWSIGNLRSFPPPPPPPASTRQQLGGSCDSPPRPSSSVGDNIININNNNNDDMMSPNAPTWGSSRRELTVSPCATPPPLPVDNGTGGADLPSYRLPRRDQGGRSQKGRHCLILPQL